MASLDTARLRQLVLFVLSLDGAPRFRRSSAVYWALYLADCDAYARARASLTGAEYIATDGGPVPAGPAREFVEATMVADGDIRIEPDAHIGEARFVLLRAAAPTLLSPEEERSVRQYVASRRQLPPAASPENKHRRGYLAWRAALAERQATGRAVIISYDAAFAYAPTLTEDDEQRAARLAAEHDWPQPRTPAV